MIKKIFYFIIFTTVLPFHILAFAQDSPLQIDTSLQAGMEYDSNVYKTFKNEDRDFLTRILLKNTGNYWLNPLLSLGWDYQGGGKKFIHNDAQDQIIQSISLPIRWIPNKKIQVFFEPNLKYQNESDKFDPNRNDVNEDFLSSKGLLRFVIALPSGFNLQPMGSFTYFHFYPNPTFSFVREETGLTIERRQKNLALGVEYDFLKQQFDHSFRGDTIHEFTPYVQYLKQPFLALSYSYQINRSSDPAFSFDNHKINFLASFLFGKKIYDNDDSSPLARFSLHFIATLQLKNYNSVFAETPEGYRYLVTGSEDENFNNLVVKFNYHFFRKWAVETKYTRISNELTNQQTKFSRSIYYAGLRFDF